MSEKLVQEIASAVVKVARPITAEEANELHEAIREVLARQERVEAVAYLCNGTRFKVAATSSTTPVVGISGLPAELAGRWVALVAADDDCHLAAASEARAWLLRKDGRMWTTHIKQSMHNYAGLGAEVTPLYTHPTPDAGRVAELEARIAEIASKHCPDYPGIDDCGPMERLYAIEATLTGRLDACGDLHARIAALEAQLAESEQARERMREALANMVEWFEGFDHTDGYCCCGMRMDTHESAMTCGHVATDAGNYHASLLIDAARSALAADKEQTK